MRFIKYLQKNYSDEKYKFEDLPATFVDFNCSRYINSLSESLEKRFSSVVEFYKDVKMFLSDQDETTNVKKIQEKIDDIESQMPNLASRNNVQRRIRAAKQLVKLAEVLLKQK